MNRDWKRGVLFGIPVFTNFPFIIRLPSCPRPPELEISLEDPGGSPPAGGDRIYDSSRVQSVLGPRLQAFREAPYFNLHLSGVGWYRIGPTSIRCFSEHPDPAALEVHLLGTAFSFWLELTGRLALHASCLFREGGGVLLLGGNGGGKTTLAVELLQQGWPLVSDDISALDRSGGKWSVSPSYPQLRLWPDAVRRLGLDAGRLRSVLPGVEKRRVPVGSRGIGTFHSKAVPVRAAYLLRRVPAGQDPQIRQQTPAEALFSLTRHCFLTRLPRKAGMEAGRFQRLADLVKRVPVFEFVYREGLDRLDEACLQLSRSLSQLRSA